jgi:hypothetical protein
MAVLAPEQVHLICMNSLMADTQNCMQFRYVLQCVPCMHPANAGVTCALYVKLTYCGLITAFRKKYLL